MNKWWLKIFSIAVLTIFSETCTMEEGDDYENKNQLSLSDLPLELKQQIIERLISDYIDQNINLNDIENLEQSIYALVKGFPQYVRKNIRLNSVNKEFNEIAATQQLVIYFNYLLTLTLSSLDKETRENLLRNIKMDKECSSLIITLLMLSNLNIDSFRNFTKTYTLIKEAIISGAIYFGRRGTPDDKCITKFSRFSSHFFGIIHFDPIKFTDTKLLKILLNNQWSVYECIFGLKSELKKDLFNIISSQEDFRSRYLPDNLAQAVWDKNIDKVNVLIEESNTDTAYNDKGQSLLILATIVESKAIINYLQDKSFYKETKLPKKVLFYAASSQNPELFKFFWTNAEITKKMLGKSFIASIFAENEQLFHLMLDNLKQLSEEELKGEVVQYPLRKLLMSAAAKNKHLMFESLASFYKTFWDFPIRCFFFAIQNNAKDVSNFILSKISKKKLNNSLISTGEVIMIVEIGDMLPVKLLIQLGINVGKKKRLW